MSFFANPLARREGTRTLIARRSHSRISPSTAIKHAQKRPPQ
jgi:hypothetical protein